MNQAEGEEEGGVEDLGAGGRKGGPLRHRLGAI